MTDSMTSFGATLASLRMERGLSQSRLAERADLDGSYVSRLETDARAPGREAIGRLAVALELDREDEAALYLAAGFAPEWMVGMTLDAVRSALREAA